MDTEPHTLKVFHLLAMLFYFNVLANALGHLNLTALKTFTLPTMIVYKIIHNNYNFKNDNTSKNYIMPVTSSSYILDKCTVQSKAPQLIPGISIRCN